MDIATILAIIGSLGGWEGIKWFLNRKKNNVDWLENRITERDKKIDAIYIELRKEQASSLSILQKLHETEMALKEAEFRKCNIRGCENRRPPSDY